MFQEESDTLLFPNLVSTLETLLQETNSLKYNLSLQVKEANNLTEWELPVNSDNESDKETPTEGTESTEGDAILEEIVSESIRSAVEHAQNVRKALTLNKSGNRNNKTKSELNNAKVTVKPKVGIPRDTKMMIKMSDSKPGVKTLTPDSGSSKNKKISSINKTETTSSQMKRKQTRIESTYQKDYLSVAKQVQKTNSKSSKSETTKQSVSQISTDVSKSNVFSFTDIDNLLSRVTPYPSSQSRSLLISDRNCTRREEANTSKACETTSKQKTDKLKLKKKASLKDALDVIGVPSELETISKIYHKYLDQKYFSEEEVVLKNEFLSQLKDQVNFCAYCILIVKHTIKSVCNNTSTMLAKLKQDNKS